MIPPEVLDYVQKAGAAAAPLLLLWGWDQRKQLLASQADVKTLTERMLTNAGEVKALLQTVVDIFNRQKI